MEALKAIQREQASWDATGIDHVFVDKAALLGSHCSESVEVSMIFIK